MGERRGKERMSEREASEAGGASLRLDSQVNQPLGGGPGGWVGGVGGGMNISPAGTIYSRLSGGGGGIGRRQPPTLLTIKAGTDSICHPAPWKRLSSAVDRGG